MVPGGRKLDEGSSHKNLGILESDRVMNEAMKSKLNGGNMIKGVNKWAGKSLIEIPACISDHLQCSPPTTRSVARLYLPEKIGGRGLFSVEDCLELAI